MRLSIVIAVASTAVLAASTSFAQTPPPPPPPASGGGGYSGGSGVGDPDFGLAHELAISTDLGLGVVPHGSEVSVSHTSWSPGSGSETHFTLQPAVDYFVIDHLSIGGFVLIATDSPLGNGPSRTTIGIGPRVGYDVHISDLVSFWPRGGFDIYSYSGGGSTTLFAFDAFAPFLFHLAPHFHVGVGPDLIVGLSGDTKPTTFGIAFTIGGWVGL